MGNEASSPLWSQNPFSISSPKDLRVKIDELQQKCAAIIKNKRFRIVICAPSKYGKSSSINNILSALQGTYAQIANAGGKNLHVTERYIEYTMDVETGQTPFLICDTPGLRDTITDEQLKVQADAIIAAVLGKFQSNEEVNYMQLTSEELETKKTIQDCAVCIVFVIDARKVISEAIDTSSAFKIMQTILKFIHGRDIKTACLLSFCDELDCRVKEDVKNIYQSKSVEEARSRLEIKFDGMPGNRIFPIVNYTTLFDVNDRMMVPSLFALKQIMTDIYYSLKKKINSPT